MKNILLGLFFILVFLPHVSFGAPIEQTPFAKQQDADAVVFFQQQAAERGDFIKAHADIIAKLDRQGREALRQKEGLHHSGTWAGHTSSSPASQPLSAEDSKTWATFMQKQLSDKQAFLAKQAQDRQKNSNS
jgi:hypothetical protein